MPRRAALRETTPSPSGRGRLSREAIVDAAVGLADREGIEAVSMRRLGQELGADPMSLYHHLRDKEALLDAMADRLIDGIVPTTDGSWQEALSATIATARRTMLAHPWSSRVIETRADAGPAAMRHINAVVGILRDGGFSIALAHHALHVLGSRVLGFSQDLFDDSPAVRPDPATQASQARAWASTMPHLAELALAADHEGGLGGCDDEDEFAFALELLIDGLERRRVAGAE